MRIAFPFMALVIGSIATGQTPTPPERATVTAEAVEVVRAKPDLAKLYFALVIKNGDAATASDENTEQTKLLTAAIAKLRLDGVTVIDQPQRVSRVETQNRAAPGNMPFIPEFHAVRPIVVTVSHADPDKLQAAVERVQYEAAQLGVSGETGNATYNGMSYERNAPVRLVYERRAGWEDDTTEALARATKQAVQRARAMAEGAGLKAGEVLSVSEVPPTGPQTVYNYAGNPAASAAGHTADARDEFTDGELVRRVRVRVVLAVGR